MKMDNKRNEKKKYTSKDGMRPEAGKWKVVIKQAPSGLEEIRPLLQCFCCQYRMLFKHEIVNSLQTGLQLYIFNFILQGMIVDKIDSTKKEETA